jgi:hypothetical protein
MRKKLSGKRTFANGSSPLPGPAQSLMLSIEGYCPATTRQSIRLSFNTPLVAPTPRLRFESRLEKVVMDIGLPKIAQLVADARIELELLGIDVKGKRPDELLNMAREQRNKTRSASPKPE